MKKNCTERNFISVDNFYILTVDQCIYIYSQKSTSFVVVVVHLNKDCRNFTLKPTTAICGCNQMYHIRTALCMRAVFFCVYVTVQSRFHCKPNRNNNEWRCESKFDIDHQWTLVSHMYTHAHWTKVQHVWCLFKQTTHELVCQATGWNMQSG